MFGMSVGVWFWGGVGMCDGYVVGVAGHLN